MHWNQTNSWSFWGLGVENWMWLHARLYMIIKAFDVVLVEVLSKSKSNQLRLLAQEVAMADHIVCIHKHPLNVKCSQREGQWVKGFCVCRCTALLFRPQKDDLDRWNRFYTKTKIHHIIYLKGNFFQIFQLKGSYKLMIIIIFFYHYYFICFSL